MSGVNIVNNKTIASFTLKFNVFFCDTIISRNIKKEGEMELSSCNLKTDFVDYYDHFLTQECDGMLSVDFPRHQCTNLTTDEQRAFLQQAEFDTLLSCDNNAADEETAHYPYKANFSGEQFESCRYVQVGYKCFWLNRTLHGAKTETDSSQHFSLKEKGNPISPRHLRHFRSPVFFIDFIRVDDGRMLAVNVDLSPKLSGMNFEQWLSPSEAAQAIQETLLY